MPAFADELIGGETAQGFEAAAVITGVDEVGEMGGQLSMAVIMIAFDGGLFDRPVHAFDLTVGPRMVRFGEAVLDPVLAATHVEHMCDIGGR